MSDEEEPKERQRLYDAYRTELDKRHVSNAENLDKSVLTYSSGGLAFSLGFLKDFAPHGHAVFRWSLLTSWGLFTFAIALVVASYPVSQKVIRIQLDRCERYFKESEEGAFDESSRWETLSEVITILSGISFCGALALSAIFVGLNILEQP
ncbi:hypothetical protein [Caballeronia insecticola]|uniref:hypothetical protein n=1 Tax=Caballeronia insecticola TaxID=758793 RepID=UPI000685A22F|nr:hypothetical protein [Caballeronia insecticola]